MKFLARTLIGIPVSFVILIFAAGSVENAVMVMALSIICTAGVSMIVWIPAWYVLGWIVMAIFGLFNSGRKSEIPFSVPTQRDRDLKAVTAYVQKAEANGLSNERIKVKLEEAGWDISLIAEALKQLASPTQDSNPPIV